MNPDPKAFIDEIEVVRKQAVEYAGFINRIKDRLSRAEKALAEKPAVPVLSSLVSDLQAMKSQPEQPAVSQLIQSLEQQLQKVRQHFKDSFPGDLRRSAKLDSLQFVNLQDGSVSAPSLWPRTFRRGLLPFIMRRWAWGRMFR